MPPKFTKFHGLGNDYLVIEAEQLAGVEDLGDFARRICNRHYGAGGDGILVMYRFHHLSNAGTGYDNSALASHMISLGARIHSRSK